MMIEMVKRVWDATLSMSAGKLIDKFLDRIDELGDAIAPARVEALVRIEARRNPFSA